MDKEHSLLMHLGLDDGPVSLLVLALAMALVLVIGLLLLGNLIRLLQSRDQTQQQLNRVAQDLRLSRDELELAVEAAGDGRWHWDMSYATPLLRGPLYDEFELGDLSREIDTRLWSGLFHPDDLARLNVKTEIGGDDFNAPAILVVCRDEDDIFVTIFLPFRFNMDNLFFGNHASSNTKNSSGLPFMAKPSRCVRPMQCLFQSHRIIL